MTLREIATQKYQPEEYDKIAAIIKTQCSEFVEAYRKTDQVLYRGLSTSHRGGVFKGRPPQDRAPKDSSKLASEMFDLVCQKLGIKALRSNSIFTSSDYTMAQTFKGTGTQGTIYVIIPVNGADYSWSKFHKDLVITESSLMMAKTSDVHYTPQEYKWVKSTVDGVIKKLKNSRLDSFDQDSLTRIMRIQRDNYHPDFCLDWWSSPIESDIRDLAKELRRANILARHIDPAKFQERYGIETTNIEAALMSKHEVLIHGDYYAVQVELWDDNVDGVNLKTLILEDVD